MGLRSFVALGLVAPWGFASSVAARSLANLDVFGPCKVVSVEVIREYKASGAGRAG